VAHLERRLQEAQRLGFTRAVLPESGPEGPPGMEVVRVRTLAEAVEATGLLAGCSQPGSPAARGSTGGGGPGVQE